MARTKPSDARTKIRATEAIRRLQMEQSDPAFRHDLNELNVIAKRLAGTPRPSIRIRSMKLEQIEQVELTEGVFIPKDLLPTPDEVAFHNAAERFKEKWNFQPMFGDDGTVKLFICMPAGSYQTLQNGEVIEMTRRGKHHADGDVDALAKYYRSLRQWAREKREKIRAYMQEHGCNYPTARDAVEKSDSGSENGPSSPQPRRRIDTDERRLKARELSAQGKPIAQIAKALFPREYGAALNQDPRGEEKLRSLAPKYMEPPHNLTWPEAERKAASEIGLDLRPPSVKLQKLTNRVRYLLKLLK